MSSFKFLVSSFKFQVSPRLRSACTLRSTRVQAGFKLFIVHCSLFILLFSCGRSYPPAQLPASEIIDVTALKREALIRVHQEFVEEETKAIEEFVESQGWEMKTTETGLWYMIYHAGRGERVVTGKIVTLEYTVSLLDGYVCYSSEEFGALTFMVGQSGFESGLEEGVLLLRQGDKARFIMPPHLAHGLVGDDDCIPQRAIIVYEVELKTVTGR